MTLLAPAAGLVAALIAGPLLLALYLLKLRRRPVRVSSTLFWDQATRDLQVNAPFRWIRPSLLFFLHLLMVVLLVLAIARPATDASLSGASRVVFVIDRSASMAAADSAAGSRLDDAKLRATRMLSELASGGPSGLGARSSVALVAFAADTRAITGLTTDLRLVRDEIASIAQSDQPADLASALRAVSALLADGDSESKDPPIIVVFSDGGPIADSGPAGQAPSIANIRFVRVGPVTPVAPQGEPQPFAGFNNTGIVSISARRDDRSASTCRVFVRLVNARSSPVTAAVTFAVDGVERSRRALTIPGASDVEPGSATDTVEIVNPGKMLVTAALSDTADLLPSDDIASVLVQPAVKPRVLLVSPGAQAGAAPGGISAEGFLTDVLLELGLERLEQITPARFDELLAGPQPLPCDLLILDRANASQPPPVPTLAFASSLGTPGLGYSPSPGPAPTYALTWKRTHPALRDVALDTLYVARAGSFDDPPNDPDAQDLARGTRGALIRESSAGGVRRIGLAFAVADCNWPLQPGFAIFLNSAIEYLAGNLGEQSALALSTARAVPISIPAGSEDRLTLSGPTTWTTPLRTPRGERTLLNVGPLERAGVYTIEPLAGGPTAPEVLAVNLANEAESSLRTADQISLAGRSFVAHNAGANDSGPSELWPWFVAAVGVLALIEWIAFGIRSRI